MSPDGETERGRAGSILLCPGQGQVPRDLGAQVRAVGGDLLAAFEARLGLAAADHVEADWARLQAALVVVGIDRGRRALASSGPVVAIGGHSLGELTALALGGALGAEAAVRLAADRGAAVEVHRRVPEWSRAGMVALSGPSALEIGARLAAAHGAFVANDNAPDQVVLSGAGSALDAAAAAAREEGLRAVLLATTGPSHSPLMAPVRDALRQATGHVDWSTPNVPVWSGLTAAPFVDPAREIAELLAAPVRWRETLVAIDRDVRPERFVDVGPGGTLAKLARKTVPDVPAVTLADLEAAAAANG